MKVLVTGGSGFIGQHVCRRLRDDLGHTVVSFDKHYSEAIQNMGIKQYVGDIRKEILLWGALSEDPDVDVVVHLAAEVNVQNSMKDYMDASIRYHDVNVIGTLNLVRLAMECGVKRIIATSSSSVYAGYNESLLPARDGYGLWPISPYGASKAAMEIAMLPYERYSDALNQIILRPFCVYGPGMRPDLALYKFAEAIQEGREIVVYGKESARDFTFIDDLVDIILMFVGYDDMHDHPEGMKTFPLNRFNVCGGRSINISDAIRLLGLAMGKKPKVTYADPRPGDPAVSWGEAGYLETWYGWKPKVSFELGIRRFAEWFQLTRKEAQP